MAYKIWNDNPGTVPTIYLHSFQDDGEQVWQAAHRLNCRPFNLVSIHDIDLDAALTPWSAKGVWKGQASFGGKAAEHLQYLQEKLIPEVNTTLPAPSSKDFLAGYSLAGLFTLWAATQTDHFKEIACVSASFWYPGFFQFFQEQKHSFHPEKVYLSLGDKESRSRHPLMAQIETITHKIYDEICVRGIPICFEMNPGNHFTDSALRMGKAIQWLLQE